MTNDQQAGVAQPPKAPKSPSRREQVAALPFRRAPDLQVLLVSSLESRRWIVPKGWPMKGRSASEAAAREAFEEAGVKGEIAQAPLGAYTYDKRKKNGSVLRCDVDVFPLEVRKQAANWPEKALRTQRWCSWREAAELVDDAELGDLIRAFAASPLRADQGVS
jgi:8-oxo-dGTP pyrophosphatase MutT (NUDIX family)